MAQTPNLDSLLLEVINSKDKNEIIQSTFDYESDSSTDLSECDDNLKKDDDFDSHKINNKKVNHGFNKVDQLSISLNDVFYLFNNEKLFLNLILYRLVRLPTIYSV